MIQQEISDVQKSPQEIYNNGENINTLGYFLDGWADLMEGMGDKADEVREKVLTGLKQREMPKVTSFSSKGYVSLLTSQNREYLLTKTDPGATTAIYIAKRGADLYASWRSFIKPVLNKNVVFTILGIAGFLGFVTGGIRQTSGGFFGGEPQTTFSLIGWIGVTLILSLLAYGGVAFAGRIWKGSFLAFFFTEPNIFDADDITAMGLAVHKTILRSLDTSGIDVTKLRLKRDFKGGRRDEMV